MIVKQLFITLVLILVNFGSIFSQNTINTDYQIGTSWTYELAPLPLVLPQWYRPLQFTITGTREFNDTLAFQIETTLGWDGPDPTKYVFVAGDSVFYWSPQLDRFVLNYVFGSSESYSVEWVLQTNDEFTSVAEVNIDSIGEYLVNNYAIETQFTTITTSGSVVEPWPVRVYRGIGNDFGPNLLLGYYYVENYYPTRLRCFENGTDSINFVGFPCLDVIELSGTREELSIEGLTVFPNPVVDQSFQVSASELPTDLRFELTDLNGKMLQSGQLPATGKLTANYPAGVYLLRLSHEGKSTTRKVIIR